MATPVKQPAAVALKEEGLQPTEDETILKREEEEEQGRRVAEEAPSRSPPQDEEKEAHADAPATADAPAAKRAKKVPIEQAPKPLTKELPEVRGGVGWG